MRWLTAMSALGARRMVATALLVVAAYPAFADNGWTRHVVKQVVQIDIPADWPLNDASQRQAVADFATKLLGTPGNVASLSASSPIRPSGALVRVTVLAEADGVTQDELVTEVRNNPAEARKQFEAAADEMIAQLDASFAKVGMHVVGTHTVGLKVIDGKLAMQFQYRRTSDQLGKTYLVTQYHVPMGKVKVILTWSYREQDAATWKPSLDRMFASVKLR